MNLQRYRGDTRPDRITVQENGVARPIGGHQFRLSVNTLLDPPDDTTELFQMVGVIVDANNGIVDFEPTPIQADQTPGVYFYDIEMVLPGGQVGTIRKAIYQIDQDITKVN